MNKVKAIMKVLYKAIPWWDSEYTGGYNAAYTAQLINDLFDADRVDEEDNYIDEGRIE